MKRVSRMSTAGARYLDLQREARRAGRPTDELIQLYALECFLDRLSRSEFAKNLILKGGLLLAALNARRPTRDIDLAAHALRNTEGEILGLVQKIARASLDDGVEFDADEATAETIRDEDEYSGIRVTLSGTLSRALIRLHVDVNVGDPIWPDPEQVSLPRLLDGVLSVRGYPLEMVLAEKLSTAIARGTANTRWRDFVDMHVLAQRHGIDGDRLRTSLIRVADHRQISLSPLRTSLEGYEDLAQPRWAAWLKKQRLETIVPTEFRAVLEYVGNFADPVIEDDVAGKSWDPTQDRWRS
ncbi:MAG: nucleotidyl transferase AbiEii/AbiGii toxin family protein [Gammaproteobacteria bacterium]